MGEMTITLQYERYTDVMHVDIAEPREGAKVRGVLLGPDVYPNLGAPFDGKVLLRIAEDGTFLGLTIYRFTSVKRALQRRFWVLSSRRALRLMAESMAAGAQALRCPA